MRPVFRPVRLSTIGAGHPVRLPTPTCDSLNSPTTCVTRRYHSARFLFPAPFYLTTRRRKSDLHLSPGLGKSGQVGFQAPPPYGTTDWGVLGRRVGVSIEGAERTTASTLPIPNRTRVFRSPHTHLVLQPSFTFAARGRIFPHAARVLSHNDASGGQNYSSLFVFAKPRRTCRNSRSPHIRHN